MSMCAVLEQTVRRSVGNESSGHDRDGPGRCDGKELVVATKVLGYGSFNEIILPLGALLALCS